MKLLKGDKVIVISGKDKGKTGVIQKVDPKSNRVVVEGVNLRKKHKKPTQQTPEGRNVDWVTSVELKNWLLKHHGILIRDASNFHGLDDHCFRVAAQTPEENDALIAAIKSFTSS